MAHFNLLLFLPLFRLFGATSIFSSFPSFLVLRRYWLGVNNIAK
jgi:hypothetical protein